MIYLFKALFNKIILFRYGRKFKDFQTAKSFCEKHTKNSYDNVALNKFRFSKFINNQEIISYTFNNSLFALLEFLSLYLKNHNKIPKILDFGGMFAENKLYLEKLYNEKFTYDVVETKAICDLAQELSHSNFYSNLKNVFVNLNNQYDLIFSSGTIQYFEKPYEIINEIFSKKIKYVVLTRTNLSNDEGVYSAPSFLSGQGSSEGHINYNPENQKKLILIPNTQIKEDKILIIAKKHNYKPLRISSGTTGNYGKNSYTKDFIFIHQ
jgi:putative methyltransferase (TIGR04325 family)